MKKVYAPACKDNYVGKAIWEDLLPKAPKSGSFSPVPEPLIIRDWKACKHLHLCSANGFSSEEGSAALILVHFRIASYLAKQR